MTFRPVLEKNYQQLSYLIDKLYYKFFDNRRQTVNYGPKPIHLPPSRRAWARDIKRLEYLNNHSFVLAEARCYQERFDRKGMDTKADIAEIPGISGARVTQYLNLLMLPESIIQYLEENQNNLQIRKYLTERRLRPLTWINDKEQCMKIFYEMIDKLN